MLLVLQNYYICTHMRYFFLFILFGICLNSCDDGDIIVTTLDFDAINTQYCQTTSSLVFFKVNNINRESLSLKIQSQVNFLTTEDTIELPIDAISNVVNYRTYDAEVPQGYFCSSIPPSFPQIKKDFISTQGIAVLSTQIIDTLITGIGIEEDTSYVFRTSIVLNNLTLEAQNETVTQELIEFGFVDFTQE